MFFLKALDILSTNLVFILACDNPLPVFILFFTKLVEIDQKVVLSDL